MSDESSVSSFFGEFMSGGDDILFSFEGREFSDAINFIDLETEGGSSSEIMTEFFEGFFGGGDADGAVVGEEFGFVSFIDEGHITSGRSSGDILTGGEEGGIIELELIFDGDHIFDIPSESIDISDDDVIGVDFGSGVAKEEDIMRVFDSIAEFDDERVFRATLIGVIDGESELIDELMETRESETVHFPSGMDILIDIETIEVMKETEFETLSDLYEDARVFIILHFSGDASIDDDISGGGVGGRVFEIERLETVGTERESECFMISRLIVTVETIIHVDEMSG